MSTSRDKDSTASGIGSGKGPLQDTNRQSFIDQSAIVYDAISEGEIEGLVDGAYTIYLNGTPVLDKTYSVQYSAKQSSNISYTASTGTITDNETANMFTGLSTDDGSRFIRIDGGAAVGNSNVVANTVTITPSSSSGITFANTHVDGNITTLVDMQPKIRITGAGQDGGVHVATITSFNSGNGTVNISPPPKTTVNNATTTIDLVDQIASIAGSNATISPSGQGVDRANVPATMSSPVLSEDSKPIYNFQNFSYAFRTGHRNQDFVVTPQGIGTAAVGISVGQDLPASTQSALGMTSDPRNEAVLDDFDGDTLDAPTHAGINISSSQFNLSDPSIIDQLKITFNHPTGLYNSDSEDGDSGPAWIELRVVFSYERDGQTFEETIFGLDDMAALNREKGGTRPHGSGSFSGAANYSAHNGIIYDKISTQFATTFSFDTEKFQPFDNFTIKLRRYTPLNYEISNKSYHNALQVGFIEAIVEDKLNYPYTAYAAVMVDSKDNTTVPKRSYEVRGIKCKVPTNYIPSDVLDANGNRTETASYNRNITTGVAESTYQDWDGKFRGDKKAFPTPTDPNHNSVYTNNPAWIFYDLLTNERYGLGQYMYKDYTDNLIDTYQLFELAKYCDELVPDGKGGTEPRFSANIYISKTTEAIKVMKDLLTVFRGILIWHDGEVSINMQQEKAPLYTFTKGNIVAGEFAYSYPSRRVQANQIRVTWNDPDNHYLQTVELVEDTTNIAETRQITSKATVAYGCTSQAQAHRVGKFHLLTETRDSEIVSFASGIGGQLLRPGDLIEIQDSDRDNVQLSGRVSSGATTTVIPVDRTVALSSAANADLTLIFPKSGAYLAQPNATIGSVTYNQGDLILQGKNVSDALYNLDSQEDSVNARDDSGNVLDIAWSEDTRIETKAISSYNATHVVVGSAFSSAPTEEVIFAISQTTAAGEKLAGSPKQYSIVEIKEQEDKSFAISAARQSEGKFDEVDRGWKLSNIPDVLRPPKSEDGVPQPRSYQLKLVKGIRDNDDETRVTSSDEQRFTPPSLDVYWSPPLSQRKDLNDVQIETPYEHIQHYEIEHNLYTNSVTAGKESFQKVAVSPDVRSFTFDNIPKAGTFIVRIRTVATNGAPSPYVQRRITINPEKPAKNLEPYVRKGGMLTTGFNIDSSNALVQFTESTYNFTPAESDLQTITVTSGTTAQTSCSFSNLASGKTGYLLWDYSDTTDPLKAIEYVKDNTGADLFRYSKNLDATAFVQKTGTANVVAGNTVVIGTGTNFLTEYEAGDMFIYDSGTTRFIATVNHIHSNTALEVAYTPTANLTNKNVFSQRIQPNFIKDTIIGEVANTSGTFSIVNYASGNKGTDAYSVNGTNENHNFPSASNGTVSDFSSFSNIYSIKKGSVTLAFASSGTALNTFGLSKADTNCTSAINSSTGEITVSAITQTTAKITVTITDRYTGETIGTRVISLGKSIPGAAGAGTDSRTVNLTASDFSIIYNSGGTSPSPSSTITLTATSQNFDDPYFKFTGDGISDETSYTDGSGAQDTFTFSVPASINTSPQTVRVGVADGNQVELAFDSITIASLQQGSAGYTPILSNEAHTFPATKAGAVSDFTNSGTSIEVYRGATRLTPVANTGTPGTDQFSVTTNSDTNITVGSYTLNTASAHANVTIGNHSSFTTSANTAEIEYSINIENELTVTKAQTFTKSKEGDDGAAGGTGPRTATGYIFYQSSSSSSPGNPSNAGISYSFSTSLLSGGVIGTGGTNWNQIQPTYTGSNSNKYWYAYFSVVEDEFNDSTPTITFSQAYQGQNFTGLVTFTGTNSITDGTNTHTGITSSDLGSSGTTTIDGGRITTGTIDAARINIAGKDISDLNNDSGFTDDDKANSAFTQANSAFSKGNTAHTAANSAFGQANSAFSKGNTAHTAANSAHAAANTKVTHAAVNSSSTIVGGGIGGWSITTYHIAGGGIVGNFTTNDNTQGNASFLNTGGLLLGSDGFISANQFYIDTAGNAKFKGELQAATGSFSGSISVGAFNTAAGSSTLSGTVNSAFTQANSAFTQANSAFGQANSAFGQANSAFGQANTATTNAASADTKAGNAFTQANTATTNAAAADTKAGNAFGQANTATTNAAAADTKAGNAYGQANTATTNAASADTKAGNAYGQANTATTNAAAADTKAGNAYGQANTATTNAATAQSTADSKVTHAAVNASSTVVGGGIGGWSISQYHLAGGGIVGNFTTTDSTQGNNAFLNTGGILLGSDGFISANTFMIDTAGNAKFKGTLEGDDIVVNGTLVVPSSGANVSGSTVGSWSTNTMDNKHIVSVGSGPGFYQGFVRLTGGTNHVKTISIQARTGSSTASDGTLIYETPRVDQYTAGNLSEGRLFSSAQTANMPIAFTYTGSGNVSMFIRAQADTGPDTVGSAEARFIKFGTTDPVFSFANQTGVALNTATYSNTQVVGGFQGTKTASISNTSFTRFKIDNGSFGTSNQNIANGSYINVEITSANANLTARTSTVTIGEASADYTVTTGGTSGGGGGNPPGGGGGCFVQGTPVVMADGTTKAIEDVTAGENVKSFRHSSLSLDENAWETWTTPEIGSGSFGTSNVVEVTDPHSHTNYYWINYNLKVTNEHPMLTFKDDVFKFVIVEDLRVGDFLICEDGTREEIFAIPKVTQSCITHNMDVEDDDTYVVRGGNNKGYVAHNVGGNQKA